MSHFLTKHLLYRIIRILQFAMHNKAIFCSRKCLAFCLKAVQHHPLLVLIQLYLTESMHPVSISLLASELAKIFV